MSRRTHPCLACPGRTRHRAICGPCRRRGITVTGDEVVLPLLTIAYPAPSRPAPFRAGHVVILPAVDNPNAPTMAELSQGIDVSSCLIDVSAELHQEDQ